MTLVEFRVPQLQTKTTRDSMRVDVSICESLIHCSHAELQYWLDCREAWRASGAMNPRAWRKYRPLIESGRYHFAHRDGSHPYGFAEAFTALALAGEGFECWTGVHLFGRRPKTATRRVQNTKAVEDRMRARGLGAGLEGLRLSEQARNPDIVAYNESLHQWRFCEVKRTEKVQEGQIIGLTLLHMLTGGEVAIARLVEDASRAPRIRTARFLCRPPHGVGLLRRP